MCVPCVLAVALVVRRLITGGAAVVDKVLAMADVERMADGRLAIRSSPSPPSPCAPLANDGGGGIVFFEEEDVGR